MSDQQQREQPSGGADRGGERSRPEPDTQPSEEWGERLDTGRAIARGGKEEGTTPGGQEQK